MTAYKERALDAEAKLGFFESAGFPTPQDILEKIDAELESLRESKAQRDMAWEAAGDFAERLGEAYGQLATERGRVEEAEAQRDEQAQLARDLTEAFRENVNRLTAESQKYQNEADDWEVRATNASGRVEALAGVGRRIKANATPATSYRGAYMLIHSSLLEELGRALAGGQEPNTEREYNESSSKPPR